MSIISVILIIVYVVALLYYQSRGNSDKFQWILFNTSVILTIFIGFGTSIGSLSIISFLMMLYDFTAIFLVLLHKRSRFSKKSFNALFFLLIVIALSFINLLINPNMPDVILMDVSMDSVYYRVHSVQKAIFSSNNMFALRDFLLMLIGLFLSKEYFTDRIKIKLFLENILLGFRIFFIIVTIEFVINNLISPEILRNIVFKCIGEYDPMKVWTAENRFGYYGVTALFPEQSYISLMIIYISIYYIKGISTTKELFWYVYGIVVLFMSGSTTGIMLLPFSIYVYIRDVLLKKYSNKILLSVAKWFVMLLFVLVGCLLFYNYYSELGAVINQTVDKLLAYINGGYYQTASESSAAIRNFGNSIAYNAFWESPIFGVGIGTTRGYGIISGLLANFGILTLVAYIYFLNTIFNFKLNRKKLLLLLILCLYFSVILSVWYSYYFTLIPIYVLFSKNCILTSEENDV